MKKLVGLLLAAALLLGLLAGCGGREESAQAEREPARDAVAEVVEEPRGEQKQEAEIEEPQDRKLPADGGEAAFSLTELGRIPAETLFDLSFDRYYCQNVEGGIRLLTPEGEDRLARTFHSYSYLADYGLSDAGYFIVSDNALDVENIESANRLGLVNVDGRILFTDEAALIHPLSSRFVEVFVITGAANTRDEAILYAGGAYDLPNFGPGADDPLYAGYSQIFDLSAERYVPGLTRTRGSDAEFEATNSLICWGDTLYGPDGGVIQDDVIFTVYNDTLIFVPWLNGTTDGIYIIYDGAMNKLFETTSEVDVISADGQAAAEAAEHPYFFCDGRILNRQGSTIIELPEGTSGAAVLDDTYVRYSLNKHTGILTLAGAEYLPCAEEDSPVYVGNGYFRLHSSNGYSLYGPDGYVVQDIPPVSGSIPKETVVFDDVPFILHEGNDRDYIVLRTGNFDIHSDYQGRVITGQIVSIGNSDKLFTLYDAITGTQLLDYAYREFQVWNDYLYAYTGDEWVVYKIYTP